MFTTFQVPLASRTLTVTRIDPSEATVEATPEVGAMHHIYLLDRSGSMYYNLDQLVDNAQASLANIQDDDYLSIIWFSGPGQFRTLVKGARRTDEISKLLDTMRTTVGVTCFSEALTESLSIIEELEAICSNFTVTLFTDGNTVTPWSAKEEETRSLNVVEMISAKSLAVNTIGYGNYYNQEFLRAIASRSQFGTFTHAANIGDYLGITDANIQSVSGMVNKTLTVEGDEIVYVSPKTVVYREEELKQRQRSKKKNVYYVVGPEVLVDGVAIDLVFNKTPVDADQYAEFLYSYAYSKYYAGDRKTALEVLAVIRDRHLIDSHMSAFTFDEVSVQTDRLKQSALGKNNRYLTGVCDADYVPAADAFCLFDLLKLLTKDEAQYLPMSKNVPVYTRIGKTTTDQFNLFKASDEEVKSSLDDLVFNSKHLNLSVRFSINGTVKLNPKSALAVGLPSEVPSNIFRTHTFVKDGALNLKRAEFVMSDKLFRHLESETDLSFEVTPKVDGDADDVIRVMLSLDSIPVINQSYVSNLSIEAVHDFTHRETQLEAQQKVLNKLIGDVAASGKASIKKQGEFKAYNAAQIQVLEEHGLSKTGTYRGVDNVQKKADECDSYETRTMEFYIKGISALPSFNDYLKRLGEGKALLPGHTYIHEALEAIKDDAKASGIDLDKAIVKTNNWLMKQLKAVKLELFSIRTQINALKLAKLLTGDWFDGLSDDGKGNFIHESLTTTMVAKTARTVEYIG